MALVNMYNIHKVNSSNNKLIERIVLSVIELCLLNGRFHLKIAIVATFERQISHLIKLKRINQCETKWQCER